MRKKRSTNCRFIASAQSANAKDPRSGISGCATLLACSSRRAGAAAAAERLHVNPSLTIAALASMVCVIRFAATGQGWIPACIMVAIYTAGAAWFARANPHVDTFKNAVKELQEKTVELQDRIAKVSLSNVMNRRTG